MGGGVSDLGRSISCQATSEAGLSVYHHLKNKKRKRNYCLGTGDIFLSSEVFHAALIYHVSENKPFSSESSWLRDGIPSAELDP